MDNKHFMPIVWMHLQNDNLEVIGNTFDTPELLQEPGRETDEIDR